MINKEAMELAIEESLFNSRNNYENGGPFGAVIVKDGKIIASSHNTVIMDHDATAHAEINVIRKASKILRTNNLEGCIIYSSTEPCPMCLSAIIWANIKEVYYANTRDDAKMIGFRDEMIYDYLNGKKQNILKKYCVSNEKAIEVFKKFINNKDREMY